MEALIVCLPECIALSSRDSVRQLYGAYVRRSLDRTYLWLSVSSFFFLSSLLVWYRCPPPAPQRNEGKAAQATKGFYRPKNTQGILAKIMRGTCLVDLSRERGASLSAGERRRTRNVCSSSSSFSTSSSGKQTDLATSSGRTLGMLLLDLRFACVLCVLSVSSERSSSITVDLYIYVSVLPHVSPSRYKVSDWFSGGERTVHHQS